MKDFNVAKHLWGLNIRHVNDLTEECINRIRAAHSPYEVNFDEVENLLNSNWDSWEKEMISDLDKVGKSSCYSPELKDIVWYKPSCAHGHTDCILDPARYAAQYPSRAKAFKAKEFCCEDGEDYDDEDR